MSDARTALDDLLRRDPLWRYLNELATPGHRAILEDKTRMVGISAMQRSGKTLVLRASIAAFFRGIHPWRRRTEPVRVLLIAPSMQQLAAVYKPALLDKSGLFLTDEQKKADPELAEIIKKPFIPKDEIARKPSGHLDIEWGNSKFGRVPSLIRHADGSELYTHISGDVNSWQRIEGMDFHAIGRDESFGNENLGNTLVTRMMEYWDKPEYPDGGFYLWGATELDDSEGAVEREQFLKKCQENAEFHRYFSLTVDDNPKVTRKNREEAARILGEEEANKRVWGTTTAATGSLIYASRFDRGRHVMAEHYEPSPSANLWVGWDPGMRHPFGLVCAAIEPEQPWTIRVCRCYSQPDFTLDQQVNCLLEWLDGRDLEGFVYDSSGAGKRSYARGERIYQQMDEAMRAVGIKVVRGLLPGRSIYKDTIPLVWRYLDPDPTDRTKQPLLLINPPSERAPGLQTGNERVPGLIEQFYRYRFKRGRSQLKMEAIERVGDDLLDPLRYLISRQPRWVERPLQHKRHQALTRSAIPWRREVRDPLADDPTAPEEIRRQAAMLRASRALAAEWQAGRRGGRRLGTRRVAF